MSKQKDQIEHLENEVRDIRGQLDMLARAVAALITAQKVDAVSRMEIEPGKSIDDYLAERDI